MLLDPFAIHDYPFNGIEREEQIFTQVVTINDS